MFLEVTSTLANGFFTSFLLFLLTLILALPLGLIIAFGSMSKFKPLKYLMQGIVWVLRGTPLMLQIFVVFYLPGLLNLFTWPMMNTGWKWFDDTISTRFLAALVAFIINYAAYFSEIYRGGIESISKGQYEACQVLGLTKSQTFFKVVLMQVVKRIIPPMSNEIITLVKDTSLANTIGVVELMFEGKTFMLTNGLIWPIFYAGAFYLIFVGALTLLFNWLEKKLSYYKV
ncbi:MAG: amino acid ABC transporter permease [Clostridia bacterium]|nr:amino acid ABC transporter permease [Clostridia bacterium]